MLSRRRGVNTTMTTINHTPAGEQRGKKRLIHRFSWVSLLVCWLIWVLNAYDREMILRLGPVISKEFSLSPEQWGNIVALIMVALAVLDIPGSIWSDRYGSGWKRARFQVPLVLGYTALSFISGIKAISHGLTAFVLLRVGVNLGAGWGEPVGVSNTLSAYRQPGVDAPGDAGKQPCRQRRRDEDLFTHPAQPQYFADGGQYPADANRLYGH